MPCPTPPQHPSLLAAEHRLRFQVQLADVEVAEREDAVLECQVPLETIPTAWYLEDRELQPSHKYVMEERGVLRRLTIRDARTDDDGIYLCQMKDKGRSIAEVSVRGGGWSPAAWLCLPFPLLARLPTAPRICLPTVWPWRLLLPLLTLLLLLPSPTPGSPAQSPASLPSPHTSLLVGVIAKRLPRKLDVMEGENAVFCVETREVLEGICWSRDGLQLRESPRTVLKSFGRTHLLVLVHVTRQDAGIISFTVGESQTSSQLRVKCKPQAQGGPASSVLPIHGGLTWGRDGMCTHCTGDVVLQWLLGEGGF